jgi:D-tyrosyl-tRNA(Tyr) deacylase
MIALIQRVSRASVHVEGEEIAVIQTGLLAFVGVRPDDSVANAERLLGRLLGFRVFADEAGRMNRSLRDVSGGLLLVPQFTLAADTRSGTRPGFSTAAPPEMARVLFNQLSDLAQQAYSGVAFGAFGAQMAVSLVNDGPVTFWLES